MTLLFNGPCAHGKNPYSNCSDCVERDPFNVEFDAMRADRDRILDALKGLDLGDRYTGPCWCGVAIGNPNYRGHSPQCKVARKVLGVP